MKTIHGSPNILQELKIAHYRLDTYKARLDRWDGYQKRFLYWMDKLEYVAAFGIAFWMASL